MTLTDTKMKGITIQHGDEVLKRPTSLHGAAIAMRRFGCHWSVAGYSPKVWIKGCAPTDEQVEKLPPEMRRFVRYEDQ